MKSTKLHGVKIKTDRWWGRAVSPFELKDGVNPDRGHPVVVHPGWGKSPERHARFLCKLADNGFFPIGVDTRYAYSDTAKPWKFPLVQPYRVSSTNPYFDVNDRVGNRLRYRRPTSLLYMCERLGIDERLYLGHSFGGLIVSLAAVAAPEKVSGLILVNAAGSGDSSEGLRRLAAANRSGIDEALRGENDELLKAASSAFGSVVYGALHLRRTLGEKQVIQTADIWDILDTFEASRVPTSMYHAVDDELISYEGSRHASLLRPWIDFTPTSGGHSNIYQAAIQDLIISNSLKDTVEQQ